MVEDVLAEAAIKFQKHFPDIQVDMSLSDDILLADMDAVLIEQVVLNLLENAVYHGKHTTRIRLSAARQGHFVLITVSDNGAGIPRDKLPKLFSAMPDSASADAQKHMGIGLSVCLSIVRAHGGEMAARKQRTGRRERIFHAAGKGERVCRSNSWLLKMKKSILKLLRAILTANKYEVVEPPQAPRRYR